MAYHIARNGQTYGPYTLEDLERYIASGHVLLTDQCRSDDSPEWTTVDNTLRAAGRTPVVPVNPVVPYQPAPGVPYQPPVYPAQPAYAQAAGNAPPNLHWGLVLLFDVLTCSLFQMVWNIIMAAWFRRVSPTSKVLWLYIASAILLLLQGGMGQSLGFIFGHNNNYNINVHSGLFASYGLVALVTWVTRLIARFTFRSELEQHYNAVEPMAVRINPVLLFFFGGIYLQSVLNGINETRRLQSYGVLPR